MASDRREQQAAAAAAVRALQPQQQHSTPPTSGRRRRRPGGALASSQARALEGNPASAAPAALGPVRPSWASLSSSRLRPRRCGEPPQPSSSARQRWRWRIAGDMGERLHAPRHLALLGLLMALLLLHHQQLHHYGALAFTPKHHQPRSSPQQSPASPSPPPSSPTTPPPAIATAAAASGAFGGAFTSFPASPPPPSTVRRPRVPPRRPPPSPAATAATAAVAASLTIKAFPPIPREVATTEKEEEEGMLEAALAAAAAGPWIGTWDCRQASRALHALAVAATRGDISSSSGVGVLVRDARFTRLLERLQALADDESLSPLNVATSLGALGRIAGHTPRHLAAAKWPSALPSLAATLLGQAAGWSPSLSGRDLSSVLHAGAKLWAPDLLEGARVASLQNLRRLAHEALARSSSSGTTPLALSPRDVAQALTGMALLGPTLWAGDDASIAPEQVAATATALAAMVARRQRPTTSEEEEIWGPQEVVGLAEGAAALAAALPPPSASVAANGAWLALEGLVQALLARAGGGAACRGPVPKPNKCGRHWEKGGKTPAAVVRLWRPRDRRRVAAALSALLPSPSLRPPAPSITTAAAAGGGGGAPERWLLRARVRTASSVAAIQALLLLHAAPAASSSSSPVVIDGVALAMAVQRLGRLCASQREQQGSTRAWLLPYITSPSVAAAVAGMDGRALASFVDGVAMLLPSGSDALRDKNGGGFLAAAVDAAMARALLPDTNEESEDGLPPWLLAPDAARLVPALVKLDYGTHSSNNNNTDTDAISSHHRPLLLHLAYRRAAAGASALPLPIVARLLYAASTTITDNNASSLSVVASAALLQRGAELLFSLPSQARNTRKPSCPCPKDVGNLVSAAAALLAHATAGDKAIIQEPLAALARGALAWEAARPVPDPTMTALDLAKLLRGLSRLFHKEKAAVVAVATAAVKTRWLARARAVLPDARLRALAAVASALAAVSVVEGEEGDEGYREALRAFVADARRRLPALVAAAAKGRDDAGGQQAEGEVVAALAVLEAAAEEGDCEQ